MKIGKKLIYRYSILLFTFILLFTYVVYSVNSSNSIHIVLDSNNKTTLSKSFRKTTDISKASNLKSINLTGLDKLNISGSSQFTEFNLPLIIESIDDNFSIINIDLREESHGFADGIAISFANCDNNANKGLSLKEIIDKENKDLSSIKLNKKLSLHNSDLVLTPNEVKS